MRLVKDTLSWSLGGIDNRLEIKEDPGNNGIVQGAKENIVFFNCQSLRFNLFSPRLILRISYLKDIFKTILF